MSSFTQAMHLKETAPYINAHRGKKIVIHLCTEALIGAEASESTDTIKSRLSSIIDEMSVLYSLDVKIILVYDAGFSSNAPIESAELGPLIAKIASLRTELESRFSMGLVNSPMQGAQIKVCSGNVVIAKPKGIVKGVDFGHAGLVRKIRQNFLSALLEQGSIVIIPPTGYSPSGEIFHVDSILLAEAIATATEAYKLIYINDGLLSTGDDENRRLREWIPKSRQDVQNILADKQHLAEAAFHALHGGVKRVHILNYQVENALLQELFTRDGSGTLVGIQSYESLRTANTEDAAGIIDLIQPLEASGVLVRRSRELIESEIEHFSVIERDGTIIGCAALHTFFDEKIAEAACIAVHPDYQNSSRGEKLLKSIEQRAQMLGIAHIFVLTTQTTHWFREQGYIEQALSKLPLKKQSLYNYQRGSKVLLKSFTS